jgi:polysaccharide biosynthesis transport protein
VAELFIDSNLKLRENQAQGTSSFLEREMEKTKSKLELQEARIAEFKRRNMGDLPEQRDTNLSSVEQLQAKLAINMDAMDRAQTRRLLLQRQAAELSYYPPDARFPTRGPAAPTPPPGPTRVEQLEAQLAELQARYTDRHPDVIRAQAELDHARALERQRPAVRPVSPDEPEAPKPQVDPTTRAELAAVDLEVRNLQAERGRILADIGNVQSRLENVPRVEQELLSLTRDYENIKNSYESLLDKRLNARLYENLEKSQQGESFTILERAQPPNAPYGPNKILVLGLGLIAGGFVGLLAALLRERSDPTYLDAESLQQAFPGLPLLATIPVFQGAGSTSRTRRR